MPLYFFSPLSFGLKENKNLLWRSVQQNMIKCSFKLKNEIHKRQIYCSHYRRIEDDKIKVSKPDVKMLPPCHQLPLPSESNLTAPKEDSQLNTDNLFLDSSTTMPFSSKNLVNEKSKKFQYILSTQKDSKYLLSFEDVPGPYPLKLINKLWSYFSLLGVQLVTFFINGFQTNFLNSAFQLKWLQKMNPYDIIFKEYGPIVRIPALFGGDLVLIRQTHGAVNVLNSIIIQTNGSASTLDSLEAYRKLKLHRHLPLSVFSGQGNDDCKKMRQNAQEKLEFKVEDFFNKQEKTTDELIEIICRSRNMQGEINDEFRTNLYMWGLECMSNVLFNKAQGFMELKLHEPFNTETKQALVAFTNASEGLHKCESGLQFWRVFPTKGWHKLYKGCEIFEGFLCRNINSAYTNIHEMAKDTDTSTTLTFLEFSILRRSLSPEQTLTNLLDFFLLGVNMTVNTASFVLYYLAKHPKVQNKLFEEVVDIIPEIKGEVDQNNYKSKVYLTSCIFETLRLMPPFPLIAKHLEQDVVIQGYKVPKGTHVLIVEKGSQLNGNNKFENPETFLPERWNLKEPLNFGIDPLLTAHFPKDLTSQLIYQQISILIAKVVRHFFLEYHMESIGTSSKFLAFPDQPLKLRLMERE